MPFTPRESIVEMVERIRAEIEMMRVSGIGITISVGIGHFDGQEMDLSYKDLIQRADEALYAAKRKGKNRIEIH
jgi:diguanylate cyclase (GGDEF)-like protein